MAAAGPALAQAPDEAFYARLNQRIVDGHIVPGYEMLAGATARLAAEAEGCDLAQIQPAFHEAMEVWMSVQHIAIGPVALLMRQPRLEFWPDSRNTGARQLDQLLTERPEISPEALADGSVALQGFPALERILFEESADGFDAYECGLAGAIAGNLAAIARDVLAEWKAPGGERDMVLAAGTDASYYASARDVTADLYQGLYEQLEAMLDLKLGRPLGDSLDDAHPRRAESWRSRRSLQNVDMNIFGVTDLLGCGEGCGFADALAQVGESRLAAEILAALHGAIVAMQQVSAPLYEAVEDPDSRPHLEAMVDALDEARELVATRMGAALGLQVGFNSLDGD